MDMNPKKTKFWEKVIVGIRNKLTTWKGRIMSFAGRVCLINFVFSSVPLFFLSMFKVPKKLQRKFLWGWGSERKK